MEKIISISELQTKAKPYVEQVKDTDEAVVITQRGRAAAVLVSFESYEGFIATRDEMRYPDWEHRLARARRNRGRVRAPRSRPMSSVEPFVEGCP